MVTDSNAFDIDTPALLIDLDRVEKNLETMQKKADASGALLRPHIKAHKIPELARTQVRLGAVGVTASKVSEAEVMADAGIKDIFIANQIVTKLNLRGWRHFQKRLIYPWDWTVQPAQKSFPMFFQPLEKR